MAPYEKQPGTTESAMTARNERTGVLLPNVLHGAPRRNVPAHGGPACSSSKGVDYSERAAASRCGLARSTNYRQRTMIGHMPGAAHVSVREPERRIEGPARGTAGAAGASMAAANVSSREIRGGTRPVTRPRSPTPPAARG